MAEIASRQAHYSVQKLENCLLRHTVELQTVDNADQAFARTGISNCDITLFCDHKFAPSDVSELPNPSIPNAGAVPIDQ